MTQVSEPFPLFYDTDGTPLEGGQIYVGVANLDPRTNPVSLFIDEALTIPLGQPVRTVAGRPSYQGSPIRIYSGAALVSVQVLDRNGVPVVNAPTIAQVSAGDITFLPAGTGAVSRPVNVKLQEIEISVTDYGAVNSLLANSSPGFQNAVNRVQALGGGVVRVPAGFYRLDSAVTVSQNGVTIRGDGMQNTVVVPATAAMNAFVFERGGGLPIAHCTISDLDIAPSAAITDCIRVIDHFWFTARNVRFPATSPGSFASGINLYNGATAYLAMLENIFTLNPNGQVGVRVGENGTGDIQNVFLYNCHLNNASVSGLRVKQVGGLVWLGGEALSCNRGATFEAGGTNRIKAVFCTNIFFDNATNETVRITVDATTARLSGIGFTGCSMNFSQSGQGVLIAGQASSTGRLERVRFNGCDILLNRQAGVTMANCRDVELISCNVQGNSVVGTGSFAGLFADNGVEGLRVIGGSYGGGDEFAATQSYGIQLSAGASQVRVAEVDLAGNATGPLLDSGVTNIVIRDCIGLVTSSQGGARVLSGGTSVVVDPGLGVGFSINDVQATPKGDVAERWWVEAVTASTFKIQLASVAAADRDFTWSVRTKGA